MVRKKQTTVEKAAAQAENGDLVIDEVRRFLQEEAVSVPTPLITEHTYGEWNLSFGGNEDVRPSDKLRFDIVDRMLRSGIVIFALEAKRSQVFRVFSEGRFKVESPDEELAEIAEAALRLILTRMAADVTYSSFAYGAYFGEMTFELADRYHLGLSDQAGGDQFWIPKVPAACHPRTIKHIRRKANREFDGFEQEPDLRPRISLETIKVLPPQALVVPINSHFRNLWGTSFLTPIYPLWVWYEIILRVMARYMDRMATPVTLAKAPSRGTVTLTDGSTPVRSLQLALRLAESVSKSNAVAIPSDRDENGQPLWEMGYLTADERSQPFIQVLEFIGQEIIRAALSADRALSQPSVASGGVGSMAIGEVHASASAVTAEMLLLEILWYLNKYFMPKISLFNRGRNGPPLWLKVQALDTRERELLMQLVNVAGNSPASQELFNMIDWQTLGETSNIPMLSEEKAQERKDKLAQEALDKMKAQQELLSETKTFPQAKEENPAQKEEDEERRKLEEVVLDLVEQGKLPWLIGDQEAEYVLDEEGRLKLFNPFRDRLGRFASKPGASSVAANKAPSLRQSVLATADYINKKNSTFDKKAWRKLPEERRRQELENLSNFMADMQNRPRPSVVHWNSRFLPLGGVYNPAKNEMVINHAYTKNSRTAISIIVHESRHGFQAHAAKTPGYYNAAVSSMWRSNYADYKSPQKHGYAAYKNQPLELDAYSFENDVRSQIRIKI